jgi:3'-phosphoadenosine 5'-phosphosulfate (PAPS) 3'-phosphatase
MKRERLIKNLLDRVQVLKDRREVAQRSQHADTHFSQLLSTTKQACDELSGIITSLYSRINAGNKLSKEKADNSMFTIADSLVQELLMSHLFGGNKFQAIVGEEEEEVDILNKPYSAGGFTVPNDLEDDVDDVRNRLEGLAAKIPLGPFQQVTIFIDPIDGTKEFSSGKGEQCTIMVGFATEGRPVAGLVYRPLNRTFAMGCKIEGFVVQELMDWCGESGKADSGTCAAGGCSGGRFLATNGALSLFSKQLAEELGYSLERAGGAGP